MAGLSPDRATSIAFLMWLTAVIVACLGFGVTLIYLRGHPLGPEPTPLGQTLIPVAIIAVLLSGIGGFTHRYLFRRYWKDGLVQPRGFLIASAVLWSCLTLAVLTPLVGAMIERRLAPNILVSTMLLLLLGTWPSGRAMRVRRSREAEDDDVELLHLPPDDEP